MTTLETEYFPSQNRMQLFFFSVVLDLMATCCEFNHRVPSPNPTEKVDQTHAKLFKVKYTVTNFPLLHLWLRY